MLDQKFIYIPSFSAGQYGSAIVKNAKFKNGKPIRLYDQEIDLSLRHDWFLAPAGHFYKRLDYRDRLGIPKDSNVKLLGDSGGFQIATGAITWDDSLVEKIFNWLEENSTYAINLDIPPRIKYDGKFRECLEISKKNFTFFEKHQTGKTKYLNVIQGTGLESYQNWYNEVKNFNFSGWSIGNAGGSLHCMLSSIALFSYNKEFENPENEIVHALGTSKIIDFAMLSQWQHSLNKIGSKIQITTDSSSPNNGSRFGSYYTYYNLKEGSFESIHVPKAKLGGNYEMIPGIKALPKTSTCDNWLEDCYTWDDINDYTPEMGCLLVLHNYGVFRDAKNQIDDLVYGHPYMLKQMMNGDIVIILNLIDQMILNPTDAINIYNKNKPLISAISSRIEKQNLTLSNNDFF